MKRTLIALALLLELLRPAMAAEAIVLSDIHFNPLADKSLAEALAAAPAEEWPGILERGRERMSIYGEDSDWKLLRAALAALEAQKKPDFVLLPGDFLVHEFRSIFNASFAVHDDAAYRRFVAKTMRLLGLALETTLPRTPIFAALGNNDADCGDYAIRPGGPFLADTEPVFGGMLGSALHGNTGFARSWNSLGNYAIDDPALAATRVIALNDNYFSPHYRNRCGETGDGNPARDTVAWLAGALADAKAAQRRVILVFHIPPGTDAFATARNASCPVTPAPLLAEPYAGELHVLMRRYRDTIAATVTGHLHTDAFRILRDGEKSFGFAMIAPGISPIFGQNPSFDRALFDGDDVISDLRTFYIANLTDAAAGAAPRWQAEASFDRAWDARDYGTASLEALFRKLGSSRDAQERWSARYGVQGPAGAAIAARGFAAYRCSVGTDQPQDFARCLCGAPAR